MIPPGVFCLWQWNKQARKWILKESYPVDIDGEPMLRANTDPSDWIGSEDEPEKKEMGRAITYWSMEGGVELHRFLPPEFTPWLDDRIIKTIKKGKWEDIIHDGGTLLLGTARAAEKIIESGTYKP